MVRHWIRSDEDRDFMKYLPSDFGGSEISTVAIGKTQKAFSIKKVNSWYYYFEWKCANHICFRRRNPFAWQVSYSSLTDLLRGMTYCRF